MDGTMTILRPEPRGYPEPRVHMLTSHDIASLIARIELDLIALRRRIHEHPSSRSRSTRRRAPSQATSPRWISRTARASAGPVSSP